MVVEAGGWEREWKWGQAKLGGVLSFNVTDICDIYHKQVLCLGIVGYTNISKASQVHKEVVT